MTLGQFPFGEPVRRIEQIDRGPKEIFVLGVYASAVHARWIGPEGQELVKALAVASEPCIFWRGEDAAAVLARISLPPAAGRLESPRRGLNGPSGVALDEAYLSPLLRSRADAWLADLVPHSCANGAQLAAIDRAYLPAAKRLGLPAASVPEVPRVLATAKRREEISRELHESRASVLILLGDAPIRWFLSTWSPHRRLSDFGDSPSSYGRFHAIEIAGRAIQVLPLAHPRQAARLGHSSRRWADLHQHWKTNVAASLWR